MWQTLFERLYVYQLMSLPSQPYEVRIFPHFTDEELKTQRSNLPGTTWLVSSSA